MESLEDAAATSVYKRQAKIRGTDMAVSNPSKLRPNSANMDVGKLDPEGLAQNSLPQTSPVELMRQMHLQELAENSRIVNSPEFPFESSDEDLGYEEPGFSRQILGNCKSWLTSMIIHLVIILSLALLTMRTNVSSSVRLELANDDFSALTDLQELEFDTAEFQSFDEADSTPEPEVPDELMEFEPEMDLPESDSSPIEFDSPLNSDRDQLQRLARELNSNQLVAGDGASSFFGIAATGESIVYIVDRSGSMQGARWADATKELMKSINSLKADQKFYVFLFSGRCHPMPQMEGRNTMVTANAENKERFRKWLLQQYPDDTTKPLSSVRRAINMRPDTIFLLTDGQFYDKTGDYLVRRAELQEKRSEPESLVINTIAFYCELDLELMLQEIAAAYNGSFRSIQ